MNARDRIVDMVKHYIYPPIVYNFILLTMFYNNTLEKDIMKMYIICNNSLRTYTQKDIVQHIITLIALYPLH